MLPRANDEMTPEDPRARRTLLFSILDGVFYSIMVGAGETYFIPYAIELGASNSVLGLLIALPILVGSLLQIASEPLLTLLRSRKRLIAVSIGLQAVTFLPLVLVQGLESAWRAEVLLVIVCAYWGFGLLGAPAWTALMGDVVPESDRGAYFGRRSRYVQITTFLSLLAGGLVLYVFRQQERTDLGFTIVFGIAAGARLISMLFVCFHWDHPLDTSPPPRTRAHLLDTLKEPRQRALVRYLTWMNFAAYVAGPFFVAYMLRSPENHGLEWSYATYTIVSGVAFLAKVLFFPLWGAASDRYGSRKCLVLAAWLIAAMPLPWLFPSTSPQLLFAVILAAQMASGFAWSGHELCSFSFLLDSAPPPERPRLVACMNTINGVMVFLGSGLGALAVLAAPAGMNPLLFVLAVSSALRFLVCGLLVHRLQEVRVVERISYRSLLFRVTAVRPQLGGVLRFFALPARGGATRRD